MKKLPLLVALLATALLTGSVAADEESERKARALFAEGNQRIEAGDFEGALKRFESAYALFPNVKILLNIATMLKELGRTAEAAEAYQRYLDDPGADPAKKPEVEKTLAELDTVLAKLIIEVVDPAMRVRVDGRLIDSMKRSIVVRVSPGSHTVVGEKDGAAQVTIQETVAANMTRDVLLRPASTDPISASPPPASAPVAAPPARKPTDTVEPPSPTLSHEGQLGAIARLDIEARGTGVKGVFGLSYGLGDHVALGASALVGRDKGVEPGGTVFILKDAVKPMISVGVPIFIIPDGVFAGMRAGAGLQWDPIRNFGVFAQAALAFFPKLPEGYDNVVFIPAVGIEPRF